MRNNLKRRTSPAKKKIVFSRRLHALLDEDVIFLANESTRNVRWESKAQALNAALRHGLRKFAPHVPVRVPLFEQVVFSEKRPRRARTT